MVSAIKEWVVRGASELVQKERDLLFFLLDVKYFFVFFAFFLLTPSAFATVTVTPSSGVACSDFTLNSDNNFSIWEGETWVAGAWNYTGSSDTAICNDAEVSSNFDSYVALSISGVGDYTVSEDSYDDCYPSGGDTTYSEYLLQDGVGFCEITDSTSFSLIETDDLSVEGVFAFTGVSSGTTTGFLQTLFNQALLFLLYILVAIWPFLLILGLIVVVVGIVYAIMHRHR